MGKKKKRTTATTWAEKEFAVTHYGKEANSRWTAVREKSQGISAYSGP